MGTTTAIVLGFGLLAPLSDEHEHRRTQVERRKMLTFCDQLAEKQEGLMKECKKFHAEIAKHLTTADHLEVMLIDPTTDEVWELRAKHFPDLAKKRPVRLEGVKPFHGYGVLEQFDVTDKDERKRVGEFLGTELHWNILRMAACYSPHHAVRATTGKRTLEFVICFTCHQVNVYEDGKTIGTLGTDVFDTPNPLTQFLDAQQKKSPAKR